MVDDHPVTRLVMTAQLAALGYAADAADGGESALAVLAGQPYDAVLLDCEMPELDGYETCRRLRQLEGGTRRTPVIALTAHTGAGDRERCLAAGMDDHLGKPVRGEELAALLERWPDDGSVAGVKAGAKKPGADLMIIPSEAALVRRVFDLYEEMSQRQVAMRHPQRDVGEFAR